MNWQQTSRIRACKHWEDAYRHVKVREEDLCNSYSQVLNTFGYIMICQDCQDWNNAHKHIREQDLSINIRSKAIKISG